MNKIIAICAAQIYLWEQERQIHAICDCARERGYEVMIYNLSVKMDVETSHSRGELSVFSVIPYDQLAALVVLSESIRNDAVCDDLVAKAHKNNVPVVMLDCYKKGCYNIKFDYEKSFEQIVRHVIEYHGCQEVNFIAGYRDNDFSEQRLETYRRVMKENGCTVKEEYIAYGDFWEFPSRAAMEKWVQEWEAGTSRRPEAIICANDMMAITASNVLQNHGLRVPEDVIVTGFDGLLLGECCMPKLTSAKNDAAQIGLNVIQMIDDHQNGKCKNVYDIVVPFYVDYSESCGCEPVKQRNLSEEVMHWYGQREIARYKSYDFFMMTNSMSDGHSLVKLAESFQEYKDCFPADNFMIIVNHNFYHDSDICCASDVTDLVKLVEICDGTFTMPLERISLEKQLQCFDRIRACTNQVIVVPIHWQSEIYGYMVVSHDAAKMDYGMLYEFSMSLDQVFGTVRKQAQLYSLYVKDALTAIYNRHGFYDELRNRIAKLAGKRKMLFMASVDLDRLKFINDHYGHIEGDFAIRSIAQAISDTAVEVKGICARFGGDEYVMCLVEEYDKANLTFYEQYRQMLRERIAQIDRESGKPYRIAASCGVIWEELHGASDIEHIMKQADDEMYADKEEHHKRLTQKETKE